jgi:UDP-N-acetylmuramoyl-L-alanyl-D-glutamate--2,6-diaminopimelate ligase
LPAQEKKGKAVVNLDDRYGQRPDRFAGNALAGGDLGQGARADFARQTIRTDFHGTSYQLDANGKSYLVRLPLIGAFNVYNSLAAIAAAWTMNIGVRQSLLALADAPAVPGRLQAGTGPSRVSRLCRLCPYGRRLAQCDQHIAGSQTARLIVVFGAAETAIVANDREWAQSWMHTPTGQW